jgi:hypothetical protein
MVGTMDAEAARRVIREQDRLAVTRIRPALEGLAREADAAAAAIPRGMLWSPPRTFRRAREAWQPHVTRFNELTSHLYSPPELWSLFAAAENEYGDQVAVTASHVQGARDELLKVAARLAADARNPALSVIPAPADVHPPRYARLPDGVSARRLTADLAAAIRDGRALDADLALRRKDWGDVDAWRKSSDPALSRVPGPADGRGYHELHNEFPRSLYRCGNPLIADPYALARAYLALRLAYIEEVLERMPDYADASGQSPDPQVQVNITNSTMTNTQIAAEIANVGSVISAVADSGDTGVAAALTALQQAVQSQQGLDDGERQALLGSVGDLAEAARDPADGRARRAATSALTALQFAAKTGGALSQALATWGDVLHRLLS